MGDRERNTKKNPTHPPENLDWRSLPRRVNGRKSMQAFVLGLIRMEKEPPRWGANLALWSMVAAAGLSPRGGIKRKPRDVSTKESAYVGAISQEE